MDRMARLLALFHLLTEEYTMVRAIRGAKCIPVEWSELVAGFARGVRLASLRDGKYEIWVVADDKTDLISCKTRLILLSLAGGAVETVTWLEEENVELIYRLGAEPELMYAKLATELRQQEKYHGDLLRLVVGGAAAASAANNLERAYRPFDHRDRIRDSLRGTEPGSTIIKIEWEVMADESAELRYYVTYERTIRAARFLVKNHEACGVRFCSLRDGWGRVQQLLNGLGRVGQWATVTHVVLTESFDLDRFVQYVGPGIKTVTVM